MKRVVTTDGVELAVTVSGPADADVAVVLVHGWCLSSEIFHRQRHGLADQRVITYDTRGHGRSGKAPKGSTTVEQLAEDLRAVLDQVCGDVPVVLVGHSMGGMTIMALAEREPSLFATMPEAAEAAGPGRGAVAGVVFVNTAAGELNRIARGLPKRLARFAQAALPWEFTRRHNAHLRRGDGQVRRRLTDALIARRILFGTGAVPEDVRLGRTLISTTHPGVVEGFFTDLLRHNRHQALQRLSGVPVRILAGGADRLTPVGHSHRIARALPHARLSILPGAGHMIPLERPEELTAEITYLTRRAVLAAERATGRPAGPGSGPEPPR